MQRVADGRPLLFLHHVAPESLPWRLANSFVKPKPIAAPPQSD
jgi:hypothetical protein